MLWAEHFDSANNIQGGFTIKRGAFFVELCHAARRCFKQLDVDTDISGDGDKFCIHIFCLKKLAASPSEWLRQTL